MSPSTSSSFPPVDEQLRVFQRGTSDFIEAGELTRLLTKSYESGQPLRLKFGMDPSSADLHVGHSVLLRKLRSLQELGHTVCLVVGDATAMVGDPSGRNKLRPQLTREAVEENLTTYVEQAQLILDMQRTEVHRNSTWFDKMEFHDVLRLASRMTVARMLERDTFQERMQASAPIGIHEFLYPLMQGWDSVELDCDVEFGGSDQLFNLLVGRQLQEQKKQRPQICITMPLITGLDGRKMSKSYANAIGLTEAPQEMFGKTMSMADDVMASWFPLLTSLDDEEITKLLAGHPREAKARLGYEIANSYHGAEAAQAARDAFDQQFREGKLPDDIPEHAWPAAGESLPLPNLLRALGLCATTSEARRLITQGAVKINKEPIKDPRASFQASDCPLLVQAGKRRFAQVQDS